MVATWRQRLHPNPFRSQGTRGQHAADPTIAWPIARTAAAVGLSGPRGTARRRSPPPAGRLAATLAAAAGHGRLRRQVSAALRSRRRVDALLRPLGLRLKGFEVRGWRTSLLRGLWPTSPTIQPIRPLRRPQYRVSSLRLIRPPKLPRYDARRPTPAAIEERLWKVIAARDGHGSQ